MTRYLCTSYAQTKNQPDKIFLVLQFSSGNVGMQNFFCNHLVIGQSQTYCWTSATGWMQWWCIWWRRAKQSQLGKPERRKSYGRKKSPHNSPLEPLLELLSAKSAWGHLSDFLHSEIFEAPGAASFSDRWSRLKVAFWDASISVRNRHFRTKFADKSVRTCGLWSR